MSSFGPKGLEKLILHGTDESTVDITQALIDAFGPEGVVGAPQKLIGGNACPK